MPLLRYFLLLFPLSVFSQTGQIRGYVYDKSNGEPVDYAQVAIPSLGLGASTDENGFFTLAEVPSDTHNLEVRDTRFEILKETVILEAGAIIDLKLYVERPSGSEKDLDKVVVKGTQKLARTNVQTSVTRISPRDIKKIPTIGASPDLATYLETVPGIITTGDQGGQLYVRGGTPIQNKILLDGMTVYNPFHSIGFFSVFDTDIIRTADVYTGGFNARYGGRISSIMDIVTRDGNKKEVSGNVSLSPFVGKALIEGPLWGKNNPEGTQGTFILSGKGSLLEQTSTLLYPYVNDGAGLPFNFLDGYAKFNVSGASGSNFNLFGFSYNDKVNYQSLSELGWNSYGFGTNFRFAPGSSPMFIKGRINFSDYKITIEEPPLQPRFSRIYGFEAGFDFSYFLKKGAQLDYGFMVNGFKTDFETFNEANRFLEKQDFSTELGAYMSYKYVSDKFVFEPSFRLQYYTAVENQKVSPEPRIGMKYNILPILRVKASGGIFTQNFASTISDRDVVNLFNGFLSTPNSIPSSMFMPNGEEREILSGLQRAYHAIGGVEYDLTEKLSLNVEGYYKYFSTVTVLNRNKIFDDNQVNADVPDELKKDFIVETGEAYGADVLLKYTGKKLYVWAVYAIGKVTRWDGFNEYAPVFDRRHNINLVVSYTFGKDMSWELTARWNYGSGFPFTQTQGFYQPVEFPDGLNTEYWNQNSEYVEIILADINQGRLPSYHRLDVSGKKTFKFKNDMKLDLNVSVTNVYSRKNIFYVNRVTGDKVYQLPVLPSLGVTWSF